MARAPQLRRRALLPRLLLLVMVLLLLVLGSVPALAAAATAETASWDEADPYAGVRGIMTRLLGPEKGQAFLARVAFERLPVPSDGNDVFELESPSSSSSSSSADDTMVVAIRGSSPLALAAGLGWYLRYFCKAFPGSWDNRVVDGQPTGRQLETVDAERLPRVVPLLRKHSAVRWRYYMNVCTVSYSMAWWEWRRWEEELDWMALSGINLALAFTGQEYIWTLLFESYGVAREDLLDGWFTGPAFFAWQRMGNIQKWGGPLSFRGFVEPQHQLQLQILYRMRILGITPILPAFAGFLPPAFVDRLPANTSVSRLPDWNGFERYDNMSGVFLLEPTDPLFHELGERLIELQRAAYNATTHMYSADTYNEMDPRTSDPGYLRRASAGVIQGMRAADPEAVWVMQGWLFHSEGFWSPEAIAAYLDGVPADALLVLDLNANVKPVWPQLVANDRNFVWNFLHNYGGRRALYGNLPAVASQPKLDWAEAGSFMVGMGVTMEAIEHNPVVFEMMLEMAWRLRDADPVDPHAWAAEYAERRYGSLGGADVRVKGAWRLLVDGVYSIAEEGSYALLSPIAREPRFGLECERLTDTAALAEAWGLLVAVAAEASNSTAVALSPFGYDLVDVTRQALAGAFVESYDAFQSAFDEVMRPKAAAALRGSSSGGSGGGGGKEALQLRANRVFLDPCPREGAAPPMARLRCLGPRLLGIIDDTEAILASNPNYLLGTWLADARAWGSTAGERDLLEFNARNQVTLWGPAGQINDYAAKQWAGLTRDYHRVRWALFVAQVLATAADPDADSFDGEAYHDAVIKFGQAFCRDRAPYPTKPVGDTVAIARRLHRAYVGEM